MSYWNLRVIKKTYPNGEDSYGIHEVYYNDDDSIHANTVKPVRLSCETVDDLREYLGWCLKCLDRPILEDGKIEYKKVDDTEDIEWD